MPPRHTIIIWDLDDDPDGNVRHIVMPRHRRAVPRTPEEVREDDAIRAKFQAWRPSLADLAAAGESGEVITHGEMVELASTGALLRAARQHSGMSLADLSQRCGMDRAAISRLENGANSPTLSTLSRYAQALGLEVRISLIPSGK